ncbi:MAG: hypothetical protein ACLVJ6_00085 [Merdibacter sp.]
MDGARERVRELRSLIASLGNVNLDAPAQFEEINGRYEFLSGQRQELQEASDKILKAIDEMDETMTRQFTEMFHKINKELDGVFKALFGGGRASLVMVDPDDVLNTDRYRRTAAGQAGQEHPYPPVGKRRRSLSALFDPEGADDAAVCVR